ncbi:hypothetical protein E8E12_006297 [Didymella heteroderae]|uniref:Cholestenol delta-isomerase n=1 Tax=Didymella heteroderae TaxID=1769908 RepID=A0A9P4WRN2_9PLEO|nr:hypothetical protein E8E12_006297 [Didymella heteroderae]
MVATRQHPRGDFPAFEPSPTKRPSRTSTASPAPTSPTAATRASAANVSPTAETVARRAAAVAERATKVIDSNASRALNAVAPPSPSEVGEGTWCHTASNITILWLVVSLPLVLWDSLYILLRPHTMAGGALQWPLWKPYEIYAAIDYVYGWPGWESNDGFGGAQGALNAVETVLYGLYVMIIYYHSVPAPTGTGLDVKSEGLGAWLAGGRKVPGKNGNRALLIGFTAAVMTLSKTVLYYFNEYFSSFKSVGHNDWFTIFVLYGVMNGLWVIFPAYMTVVFGSDILQALDNATEAPSEKEE